MFQEIYSKSLKKWSTSTAEPSRWGDAHQQALQPYAEAQVPTRHVRRHPGGGHYSWPTADRWTSCTMLRWEDTMESSDRLVELNLCLWSMWAATSVVLKPFASPWDLERNIKPVYLWLGFTLKMFKRFQDISFDFLNNSLYAVRTVLSSKLKAVTSGEKIKKNRRKKLINNILRWHIFKKYFLIYYKTCIPFQIFSYIISFFLQCWIIKWYV